MTTPSIQFSTTDLFGATQILTPLVTTYNPLLTINGIHVNPPSGSWVYYLLEYPGGFLPSTINITTSGFPTIAGVANAAYVCLVGAGGLGGSAQNNVTNQYTTGDFFNMLANGKFGNGGNGGGGDIIISGLPYNLNNTSVVLQPQGISPCGGPQAKTVLYEINQSVNIQTDLMIAYCGCNGGGSGIYQPSHGIEGSADQSNGTDGGAGGQTNGIGGCRGAPGQGGNNEANGTNGSEAIPVSVPSKQINSILGITLPMPIEIPQNGQTIKFMDGLTGPVLVGDPSITFYNDQALNSNGVSCSMVSSIMVYFNTSL